MEPNFPNLLRHETLHVSGSSSAHHQKFIHRTLGTRICHADLKAAFEQDQDGTGFILLLLGEKQNKTGSILVLLESSLQTCMTYTSTDCTVNKLLMMGTETPRNM